MSVAGVYAIQWSLGIRTLSLENVRMPAEVVRLASTDTFAHAGGSGNYLEKTSINGSGSVLRTHRLNPDGVSTETRSTTKG